MKSKSTMEKFRKLLIATRNKGKFPEITAKLVGLSFEFLNLSDIADLPKDFEVDEPAMTFEGNAIAKAMVIGMKTGLTTLADDSGLEVDALGGKPGVFSARYAPGTDEDRCKKLLHEMEVVPDGERGAQFHSVIAIYNPMQDKLRTCEGIVRGKIAREPRGANGFGYDPIFFILELGKTTAELSIEEKNKISHRGKALEHARELLQSDFQ